MDKLLIRQYAKDSVLLFILSTKIPLKYKIFIAKTNAMKLQHK